MVPLALVLLCSLATGYWVSASVKREDGPSPIVRGLGVAVVLAVTPFVVFFLISVTLTGGLPVVIGVIPVVLLGLGLYTFATGSPPAIPRIAR